MHQKNNKKHIRPRHHWLMILRLGITSFLLISLFLIKIKDTNQALNDDIFKIGLLVLTANYFLALIYYYILPIYLGKTLQNCAQIVGDLILAISIIIITGNSESPFSFLFLIAIINSSFLGGIRTALVVSTFSAALWGALISVSVYDHIAPSWLPLQIRNDIIPIPQMVISILINTGACYLVAILSGSLANQLFISRQALASSQGSLERLAELNENIIQSIDSCLLTTDINGILLSINRAGLECLGYEAQEVIGRPWQTFLSQLEHIIPSVPIGHIARLDSGALRFEYLRKKDGKTLLLELEDLAMLDKNGMVWGRLFVIKDLTAISKLEAEMKKAEHLAALGELAAGMAHEVRTPLASMTGAWQMLAEHSMPQEDEEKLMNIIGREMERLGKLVTDFLSFARPATGSPQQLDLVEVLQDQINLLKHSRPDNVIISQNFDYIKPVWFDHDQLVQIIWNLLRNALEAGDKNEEIKITITTEYDDNYPWYVALRITDNGPGISHENLRKIFEPFFTTKSTGTGLGLATISRLIHNGGGYIDVKSSLDSGTIFSVYLPQLPQMYQY